MVGAASSLRFSKALLSYNYSYDDNEINDMEMGTSVRSITLEEGRQLRWEIKWIFHRIDQAMPHPIRQFQAEIERVGLVSV